MSACDMRLGKLLRHASGRSRAGQAAIEFIAGLLLFLILVTGTLHVCRMGWASLFLHAVLRGQAGERAMASTSSDSARYVSDWQAGDDETRFTADDQPVQNGAMLTATLDSLTSHSVHASGDWNYVTDRSRLPVSMITLHASPTLATTVDFVHREETLYVPVDTVIRQLVYDKDEVAIKEGVWMPLMGGLY